MPFRFSEREQLDDNRQLHYRVVRQAVLPASIEQAAQLKIALGAPVIHIAQLKLDGETIVAYSERFLPQALCPSFAHADLTRQSIHDILAGSAEEPPVRATIEIDARQLAADDAQLLGVAPGTPAIVVNRMSYTAPARPAVWYRGPPARDRSLSYFPALAIDG